MRTIAARWATLAWVCCGCAASTAVSDAAPPLGASTSPGGPPEAPAPSTAPPLTNPRGPALDPVYAAWVQAAGGDAAQAREATVPGPPGWRFFFVARAPGDKSLPAAVHGSALVHAAAPTSWDAIIGEGSVEQAASAVAWLLGTGAWLAPDRPLWAKVPSHGTSVVTGPTRTVTAAGTHFAVWLADPPGFSPYRVDIDVHGSEVERTTRPLDTLLSTPPRP